MLSLRPRAPGISLNFWDHLSKCNHCYKQKIAPESVTLCGEGNMCYDTYGGYAKKLCENTKGVPYQNCHNMIIAYYL